MSEVEFPCAIKPAFEDPSVNVFFASSEAYAPYAAVAISSVIHHASKERLYDIIFLFRRLKDGDRAKILSLADGHPNVTIRFINVGAWVDSVCKRDSALSIPNYYRLLGIDAFFNYGKMVYLDCDLVLLADVAELFDSDLKGHTIGATRDFHMIADLIANRAPWWAKQLRLSEPDHYLNSGVMVINLNEFRSKDYKRKCIQYVTDVGSPRIFDQDAISHCLQGDVEFLDPAWNAIGPWTEGIGKGIEPGELPEGLYKEYQQASRAPRIIHYASAQKPWLLPHLPWANEWWKCALETPYSHLFKKQAMEDQYRQLDGLKKALEPVLLPKAKRRILLYAIMVRLSNGNSKKKWEKLLQEAKAEYRSLTRKRFVPTSKFVILLRNLLRI